MPTALLTIFCLALLAPALHCVLRSATGWVLALPVLGITGWFATLVPAVSGGKVLLESKPWVPGLGIDVAFRTDGWCLVFLLLISGIGALILIYSGGGIGTWGVFLVSYCFSWVRYSASSRRIISSSCSYSGS